MSRENELFRRFHEQHAVATLRQLTEAGLSARAVQKRSADGRLHRIHHGVYGLVPREHLSRDGRYMAAVLACGPQAVLSHRSAAALHELRATGTSIEVTLPGGSSRAHEGIRVHHSITLARKDVTEVNNIRVTTVARTLLDLAEVLPRRPLERAFDQAEILQALDLNALTDQLARNPKRHRVNQLKAVLYEHYIGSTPTVNELEEAMLALTRRLHLPDPEVNAWIVLDDGEPPIKGDFVWRDRRVVVETDGRRTHATRQAFESDRRRDQRLTMAGWRCIRTTWRQITRRPAELQRVLVQVVGRG